MYCPICLNETLKIKSQGVLNILINQKMASQTSTLFNIKKLDLAYEDLKIHAKKYFDWYSSFQNKKSKLALNIVSSDFTCESKCSLGIHRISVLDFLLNKQKVLEIFQKEANEYNIQIYIAK